MDSAVEELLAPHVAPRRQFEDQEIVERLMVPMCIEAARCLEDGIVDSATELDAALPRRRTSLYRCHGSGRIL